LESANVEEELEDHIQPYQDMGYVYEEQEDKDIPKANAGGSNGNGVHSPSPLRTSYHEMYHLYYEDKEGAVPESGHLYQLNEKNNQYGYSTGISRDSFSEG
jgi:hypothetical protein